VRLVCLIEGKGASRYQDSVFLIRASEFRTAFERALEIGRSHEEVYRNPDGQRVAWHLKEIMSLDVIRAPDLDGAEVYSEPIDLPTGEVAPFGTEYAPETSEPTQTI
jgi:hypothetical protein